MPAERFTRKASTPTLRRQFAHVEQSALDRGDDPGTAVRKASGVVKRSSRRGRRSSRRSYRQ
jgi:hypothetical protein